MNNSFPLMVSAIACILALSCLFLTFPYSLLSFEFFIIEVLFGMRIEEEDKLEGEI